MYVESESRRGFGDIELRRHAATATIRQGAAEAARNLLEKALRALDDGDHDRVAALVDRALALPYDEGEQAVPAAFEAHMMLFTSVVDELELADDASWLDAAIAALHRADELAVADFRSILQVVLDEYDIDRSERRRLATLLKATPQGVTLEQVAPGYERVRDHIVAVLAACLAYDEELAEV